MPLHAHLCRIEVPLGAPHQPQVGEGKGLGLPVAGPDCILQGLLVMFNGTAPVVQLPVDEPHVGIRDEDACCIGNLGVLAMVFQGMLQVLRAPNLLVGNANAVQCLCLSLQIIEPAANVQVLLEVLRRLREGLLVDGQELALFVVGVPLHAGLACPLTGLSQQLVVTHDHGLHGHMRVDAGGQCGTCPQVRRVRHVDGPANAIGICCFLGQRSLRRGGVGH
mmetsp:Transcript_63967/g.105587  ORF Transcript_63967/g.105587 Transcript_63967/m.105587 type:complete len:221 (+) Transcript_63967:671-1333(+)